MAFLPFCQHNVFLAILLFLAVFKYEFFFFFLSLCRYDNGDNAYWQTFQGLFVDFSSLSSPLKSAVCFISHYDRGFRQFFSFTSMSKTWFCQRGWFYLIISTGEACDIVASPFGTRLLTSHEPFLFSRQLTSLHNMWTLHFQVSARLQITFPTQFTMLATAGTKSLVWCCVTFLSVRSQSVQSASSSTLVVTSFISYSQIGYTFYLAPRDIILKHA